MDMCDGRKIAYFYAKENNISMTKSIDIIKNMCPNCIAVLKYKYLNDSEEGYSVYSDK